MPEPPSPLQQQHQTQLGKLELNYLLYLPDDYDAQSDRDWPFILFLHGAGEKGHDLSKVKRHGIARIVEERRDFPFIAASPQCPPNVWWTQLTDLLAALVDEVREEYRIDDRRLYLTGMSMGGYGAWKLAAENPATFAAVAPICGGGDPNWAPKLANVPIWAFHGDSDYVVPTSESVEMVEALRSIGADVRFTLYEGVGHDSWTQTYANSDLYEWFLEHERG